VAARAALALALVGACAPASADEHAAPPERAPHERIDEPALVACGGCHTEVYKEWSESLHARAWTNPNARGATRDFEVESCRACHSPLSVFTTGFDRRPDYRPFNQRDGVHCLSCHGLVDGVAAARTIPDAPCRPRLEPQLLVADHCYPCHEPTHQAFAEYETSDAFALGLRCVDCHMPVVAERGGRSHGPHGGMNADFVRKGLGVEVVRQPDALEVVLRNRTGHRFPGEIPSRALVVLVSFDGGPEESLLLRKPNKGEAREDDRLAPDEVRRLRFARPPGVRSGRVRVLFQPLPLLPPEACFALADTRVEWE
jgi:hypothetical protein